MALARQTAQAGNPTVDSDPEKDGLTLTSRDQNLGFEALESTIKLYDVLAADYDASFKTHSLRRVYDHIAWEQVQSMLPSSASTIVDVGCGTGRWVARCVAAGHQVVGIEPSGAMQRILQGKAFGKQFTLLASGIESATLPDASADVVLAMGSLQYSADPVIALKRMFSWLRPGGLLFVHVDGLVALTLELMRIGRLDEALIRLERRQGVFTYAAHRATLHLFDCYRLSSLLSGAGLIEVETRGLLIAPSAWGREHCELEIERDENAYVALERRLFGSPALAEAGKHIMAWGRSPS